MAPVFYSLAFLNIDESKRCYDCATPVKQDLSPSGIQRSRWPPFPPETDLSFPFLFSFPFFSRKEKFAVVRLGLARKLNRLNE